MAQISVLLGDLTETLPLVVLILGSLLFITIAVKVALRILDNYYLLKKKMVFIEITPPASTDRTPVATQRLFSALHGLERGRTLPERLLNRKATFSLEIVSTRKEGIRYILRVAESEAKIFEQAIISYLPDAHLRYVGNFLPQPTTLRNMHILEIKQTGHFAYPLYSHDSFEQYDPMAYLTGAMTKLASGELMSFQIVGSAVKVREANRIAKRILHNEELLHQLGKQQTLAISKLFTPINNMLFGIIDGLGEVVGGSSSRNYQPQQALIHHKQQVAMQIKPARTLSTFEQKLAESVYDKLSQPLFRVSIRAVVLVSDKHDKRRRIKGLRDWLALFNVSKYQSLQTRRNFPSWLKSRYRLFLFKHRLLSLFARNDCLLSAAEVANLYHFPHTQTAKTENVVKSLSRTLPAPVSLKGDTGFDVILGRNRHHGAATSIGLTTAERERHVYVIGGTGNGKTTMLQYAIVQDIQNGKGVAVIDPHGDLAETIIRYIPAERVEDVIYFNPDDMAYPIGLNVLELTPGLTGNELLREKDLVTESVISIFRKVFSDDDTGGHRIEYVLRNTIQTALTVEGATLFTIYNLLNDPKYCKRVVRNLESEDLKNFWKNELGKAGGFQQVKMVAGITAKIGRFLFSASAKRILEQPKSTINFDNILDGKILICNFSKGLLGEDTSELFGISVLARIQMAALRRARQKQAERKPFYLYVDEFQNFATPSFVQMLSEARKYKLFLIMAEQSTSQQNDMQTINVILANVGTIICFRSGNPADERLMLPLFNSHVEEGEIANLPSFNFYMRISAAKTQEPFSGETILLEHGGHETTAQTVAIASRANYTTTDFDSNNKAAKVKERHKSGQVVALPGDE